MHVVRRRTFTITLLLALVAGFGVERRAAQPSEMRLVVNLATYELEVYEGGERTRSFVVAVGKPGHRTPAGTYTITRIVWNPWWYPPPREWARDKRVTPPGPSNPMGRVKLSFRNLYYVHGTPHTETLGQPASHGCVRMRNSDAIELARLVHRYGSPAVDERELDRLAENHRRTRTIWLENPVTLSVTRGADAG